MRIKTTPTPYAPRTKRIGKRKVGGRLIDNSKFYTSGPWRKLRNEKIKQNPLCEHCSTTSKPVTADVVDHIVPFEVNNELGLDPDNLQSLCHRCHASKSAQDKKDYPDTYNNADLYYL